MILVPTLRIGAYTVQSRYDTEQHNESEAERERIHPECG